MKARLLTLLPVLFLTTVEGPAQVDNTLLAGAEQSQGKAQQLAKDVWKASGGENWAKVKELHFTFIVEQDGKEISSAEHAWNVAAFKDRVKWKGKDVTVNVAVPAQDEESKAAHARWVNDSYWLLAPLKILDPGVKVSYEGMKDADGASWETLRLSFERVGLTPEDNYRFYINPDTKLIQSWDYIPKPETVMHGTWDRYEDFGGLKLATEHVFAGKVIRFANVKVVQ